MLTLTRFEFDTITVDAYGQLGDRDRAQADGWVIDLEAGVGLELVSLMGGSFAMGAPPTEEGWHSSQSPQHEVVVAPLSMSRTPITQAQWQCVAQWEPIHRPLKPNPSCFTGTHRPVEQVSWEDAVEFCDRLTQYVKGQGASQAGLGLRLPTEAEWEYACRGGTTTPFWVGDTLTTAIANYSGVNWEYEGRVCSKGFYGLGSTGDDRRETTEVGLFGVANRFGLVDMHGLVREWCLDCWHPSYSGAPTDGSAWLNADNGDQRVVRGGSWNSSPNACRSAYRNKLSATTVLYDVGFRVVAYPSQS